jgi:hypothetical protein
VWIGPAALATRIERDDTMLILDVRGPDEFTGPLGHIREATNTPLIDRGAAAPGGRPVGCFSIAWRDGTVAGARLTGDGIARKGSSSCPNIARSTQQSLG